MASRWEQIRNQLAEPFRVTVQREETFEEVNTFSVNLANLLAIVVMTLVSVSILTFALIALTPIRTLLPGFGELSERKELVRLSRELREIEGQLDAQEAYTANVQRILVGDIEQYDATADNADIANFADSMLNVDRIPEDEQLRKDVAKSRTRYQSTGNDSGMPLDQLHLIAPLTGTVSSPFDPTDRHFGVDIVAPANTPIKSTLDGHVVEASWTLETGNVIAVQHAGELISFYKHNSSLLKRSGDRVRAGEAIAIIGNTGTRTDGPHLHFELWYRGQPVNPVAFVNFE